VTAAAIHIEFADVAATLALVAVAIALAIWERTDLEGDITIAVARSFIQLTAIGYVIDAIFDSDNLLWVAFLLTVMVLFGAFTARGRATRVSHAFWPLLFALAIAATATLALVLALGVFPAEARYLVPVGGMVIGNAMTASAVALNRLGDDIHDNAGRIEATLALGATATEAVRPITRRSLRSGMIPLIDSTKTTGLIFFPGTMVGMLLAGASPGDAVRLQLVLLYVLLGAVALSTLLAVLVSRRAFFTADHQLREPAPPQPHPRA
jgi:putative ABC transport system permease protein